MIVCYLGLALTRLPPLSLRFFFTSFFANFFLPFSFVFRPASRSFLSLAFHTSTTSRRRAARYCIYADCDYLGERLAALCLTPYNLRYIGGGGNREEKKKTWEVETRDASVFSTDHHNKDDGGGEREGGREGGCDKPALFQPIG